MPHKYTHKERIDKFWKRVNITGLLDCWEWQGAKNQKGYGLVWKDQHHPSSAHRFAWEATYYPIPKGKLILHKCDNPPCCNPNHLYLGTNQDNMNDRKKRNPHHPRTMGENHPSAKLTEHNVREIKRLIAKGDQQKDIAKGFSVSTTAISRINTGRTWTHIK